MPRTLPDGRRLGAHLPLGAGMVAAADRAHAIGARAIQVFADNPTAWHRRVEPPRELAAFRARLAELDIGPLAIHAAYLINLAGPEDDFWDRSLDVLISELRVAPTFGARFVNVHIGSHKLTGFDAGIERLGTGIARALAEVEVGDGPLLVLENSAGGGGGIGATVSELAAVFDSVDRHGADMARVALCLDTAHLWGAGYELDKPEAIDSLLDELDRSSSTARALPGLPPARHGP